MPSSSRTPGNARSRRSSRPPSEAARVVRYHRASHPGSAPSSRFLSHRFPCGSPRRGSHRTTRGASSAGAGDDPQDEGRDSSLAGLRYRSPRVRYRSGIFTSEVAPFAGYPRGGRASAIEESGGAELVLQRSSSDDGAPSGTHAIAVRARGGAPGVQVGNLVFSTGLDRPREISIPYSYKVVGTLRSPRATLTSTCASQVPKVRFLDVASSQPGFALRDE